MIPFNPSPSIVGGFIGRSLKALEAYGLKAQDFVLLKQVHGDVIYEIRSHADILVVQGREGDALISTLKGTPVAVKSADCVPILIAHPRGVIAAVHAGWRGTSLQVLSKVLAKLKREYRLDESTTRVAIGPAISGKRYEVGPEVAKKFSPFKEKGLIRKRENGKYLLDLAGINLFLAQKAGVPRRNIQVHPVCTLENFSDYYSYRGALARGLKGAGRNYSWVRLDR